MTTEEESALEELFEAIAKFVEEAAIFGMAYTASGLSDAIENVRTLISPE